jgi:replicative superfamily II helicase
LKYATLIDTVFKDIGRESRGNQSEIINQVLVEFFDNKKQNVVLNAPTGIGKSIIGAVIAGCVEYLSEKKRTWSFFNYFNGNKWFSKAIC